MQRETWPTWTWLQEYLHPREFVLFGVALLLATSLLLVAMSTLEDDHLEDLNNWAARPWQRMECEVLEGGISYLGDCDNTTYATLRAIHRMPDHNYSHCAEEVLVSKICRNAIRRAFQGPEGRRLAQKAKQTGKGAMHRGDLCRDSFLTWASVKIPGVTKRPACAYRTGLLGESGVETWEEAARAELEVGLSAPCWVLVLQSVTLLKVVKCPVVALDDPIRWPEAGGEGIQRQHVINQVLLWFAILFACAGAGVASWHYGCVPPVAEVCFSWDSLAHRISGTHERFEAESERVQNVQDRWRLFRTVLREYQPLSSARDYAPVARSDDLSGDWSPVGAGEI